MLAVMTGYTNDFIFPHYGARRFIGNIILPDMRPIAVIFGGQFGVIVQNKRHIMAVRDRHELRNRFGNKRFISRVIVSIFQTQLQASDIARGQRFIKQRSEFGHM